MLTKIINFAIIAHIDHGKSTLADRLLEITKTVPKEKLHAQFLDINPIERERGVTIKMQPVTMEYNFNNNKYILNLIDTPGHIDFTYEVERALSCIEGAILLIDITQGIQAQTIYNLEIAKKNGLIIIPTINKIDLMHSLEQKDKIAKELHKTLKLQREPLLISAKTGQNVENLLHQIITTIPSPAINIKQPLQALVFDSIFDVHKGVILFLRLFNGTVKTNDEITLLFNKRRIRVKEVGYFKPYLTKSNKLSAGEIGYIATGIKETGLFLIGDTITSATMSYDINTISLHQFEKPKPVLYVNIFPYKDEDFDEFLTKINKYRLNDPSMVYEKISDKNLGRGIKGGFLGQFHLEIFLERMKREENIQLFITKPSVEFKINYKDKTSKIINQASDLGKLENIISLEEPYAKVHLITPVNFFNEIYEYLTMIKAEFIDFKNNQEGKMTLEVILPLRKIIEDFHDSIKSISQGYASYYYEVIGYRISALKKVEIIIHGVVSEIFSVLMPYEEGVLYARYLLKKLKEKLPREQFQVKLQASINGKIVAREDLPALRKDIAGWLYGGDRTRKMKLWQKQAKTKKELGKIGKVRIPPDLFIEILKRQ